MNYITRFWWIMIGMLPSIVLAADENSQTLKNPIAANSICQFFKQILDIVIYVGVPVIIVFLVLAGARFVWARGNQQQLAAARQNLFYTVVGIVLFLGSWTLAMIVASVIRSLGGDIAMC